jgi:hypothetical protein
MPGGYVVRDANGQTLAFVYSRDTEGEARQAKVNGGGLFVLAGGAVSTLLAGSRAPPRIMDRLGDKHRAVDAAIEKVR